MPSSHSKIGSLLHLLPPRSHLHPPSPLPLHLHPSGPSIFAPNSKLQTPIMLDQELVLYACVAEAPTILADVGDPSLQVLAAKCVQQAPAHHCVCSHTVSSRSYTLLMDGKFVFFGVFDERLEKGKRLWFLKQMREGFDGIVERDGSLGVKCLQVEMGEVFGRVLEWGEFGRVSNVDGLARLGVEKRVGNGVELGLGLKKKRRVVSGEFGGSRESELDLMDGEEGGRSKEFTGLVSKHCGGGGDGKRAVRSGWRKRVWFVLVIDLFVCLVMFGAWLYICDGLKCLDR